MDACTEKIENLDIKTKMPDDVTVEVRMHVGFSKNVGVELKDELLEYIKELNPFKNWSSFRVVDCELENAFDYILVGSPSQMDGKAVYVTDETQIIFYSAKQSRTFTQEITDDEDGTEGTVSSLQCELPCAQYDRLWENLFYEDNVKGDLLSFTTSLVTLSQLGVDTNVIDLNRLILLHGPPGSGKTTLCKGLAQRLAVRLQYRYKKSVFVEVNSHTLFSKWFSESGKFVQKLFDQIAELALNDLLIFVLVDEVESLVMERAVSHGSDPSDSVRAVNAVLTQIDQIRRFPNVLVFATSNITAALDQAFMDRADLTRFIGQPSRVAASKIITKGIVEFARLGILDSDCTEERVYEVLAERKIVSGRMLKKLPVLIYSRLGTKQIKIKDFLRVLSEILEVKEAEVQERTALPEVESPPADG